MLITAAVACHNADGNQKLTYADDCDKIMTGCDIIMETMTIYLVWDGMIVIGRNINGPYLKTLANL